MSRDTVNRNVEIRDLPVKVDLVLKALSTVTGKTKLAIYREALIEYAERHQNLVITKMGELANG